jgi:hypothetical protein
VTSTATTLSTTTDATTLVGRRPRLAARS